MGRNPFTSLYGQPATSSTPKWKRRIVRSLIEFAAIINIRCLGTPCNTALQSAVQHSPELVIYLLEEKKVDTNLVDGYGRTIVSDGSDSHNSSLIHIDPQHHWATHDTEISRNLRPCSARLKALREGGGDFLDVSRLYMTILIFLNSLERCFTVRHHYGFKRLSRSFFGPGLIFMTISRCMLNKG